MVKILKQETKQPRDFIHVLDLADIHILSISYLLKNKITDTKLWVRKRFFSTSSSKNI